MSQSKSTATAKGSCLCESVKYTVTGDAKKTVLCHCSNCRKASGSAFAHNAPFLKAKIEFQEGRHLVKVYADSNTKSGNTLRRHHCTQCGSPIFLTNSATPGLIILHAGLISDLKDDKPGRQLFQENRRTWLDGLLDAKL